MKTSFKRLFKAFRIVSLIILVTNALDVSANEQFTLDPVMVYGLGFGEKLSQALPQTEIITSTQIQKSGYNTVGDVLERVGNVFMRQDLNGNLNGSPDIRGYGATSDNNTVILVDNVRISRYQQAPAQIWNIPVEGIDHIEIIRGSSSVLYGEGATSGVINIITKKNHADQSTVSAGVGSYGTYNSNGFISRKIDNLNLSIFGKTTNTDGFREQDAQKLKSAGINLDYTFDQNLSAGIKYADGINHNQLPGSITLAQYSFNPRQAQYNISTLQQPSTSDGRDQFGSLFIKYILNDYEYLLDLSRKDNSTSFLQQYPGPNFSSNNLTSQQNDINLKLKINNLLTSNNTFLIGIYNLSSYRNGTYNDNYATPYLDNSNTLNKQNANALYFQDDYFINNSNRVTIGYRTENFRQSLINSGLSNSVPNQPSYQNTGDWLKAYELEYTNTLNKQLTNYLKFGQGFRLPNVDDTNKFCALSYPCVQNFVLKPQINRDIEIGTNFTYDKNHGYIKLYHSLISNEIIFDYTTYGNINASQTRRQGLELSDIYDYSNKLSLNANANFVNAVFLTDTVGTTSGVYGKSISGTPSYIFRAGIDYKLDSHNMFGIKTIYTGSQYAQGDNQNLFGIGGYSITNLNYIWDSKHWSFITNLNNIFNRKYFDTAIFTTSYPPYVVYPNMGFNFLTTLKYKF